MQPWQQKDSFHRDIREGEHDPLLRLQGGKEQRSHLRSRWQRCDPSGCILASSPITLIFPFHFEVSVHISGLTSPGRCISWSPNHKIVSKVKESGCEWCSRILKNDANYVKANTLAERVETNHILHLQCVNMGPVLENRQLLNCRLSGTWTPGIERKIYFLPIT